MHVYFLWVFTYRGVMGLAKIVVDATCLLRGNRNIFLSPPLDLLLSLSSLISVFCYLHPSVCVPVSHTYLDLPLLSFLCLFLIPSATIPFKWIILLFSWCAFSCFHFVFLFLFLFLIQFSLSFLSCSHWVDEFISFKCHILPEWAFIQNFSYMSLVTFRQCVLKIWPFWSLHVPVFSFPNF